MPNPVGALGCNKTADDLFGFRGKIHQKEWSSRCLGSAPGDSFPENNHSHPPPSPLIQDFLLYCSTTPFSEQIVVKKQQPMKDAGQGMARLLRTQPGCDKPGAEHTERTPYRVHSTQGTGSRGAWSRRQTYMGFFWDRQAICLGSHLRGKIRGLKAEGSQSENPEALVCVLQKPMLKVQRHPACSWHALKVHRQTLSQFHFCLDYCTMSICKPTLCCLVIIDLH